MNDLVRQNNMGRADGHLAAPERVPHGDEARDDYEEEAEQHIWRSVD